MFFFDDDTKKTLHELLEVLRQGIDLLVNNNLNADLYYAYEKYVIATIKLVDNAYWKNYVSMFEENSLSPNPVRNLLAYSQFVQSPNPVDYKEKLKILLKKIITVVEELM